MTITKLTEYATLTRNVEALTSIDGVKISDDYKKLSAGIETLYATYTDWERNAADNLRAAIRDNKPEKISAALDHLAASHDSNIVFQVNIIVGSLLPELQDAYQQTAALNYDAFRSLFNLTWEDFTAAANTVDLTITDPLKLLPLPKKAQEAWQRAHLIAHQLDEHTRLLETAALAAGLNLTHETHTDPTDRLLPLVVNPTEHHLRRVWEAWDSEGEFGHWQALHAAGITVNARPLDEIDAQRRAAPLEQRVTQGDTPGLVSYRTVMVDPEDDNFVPAKMSGFTGVPAL